MGRGRGGLWQRGPEKRDLGFDGVEMDCGEVDISLEQTRCDWWSAVEYDRDGRVLVRVP